MNRPCQMPSEQPAEKKKTHMKIKIKKPSSAFTLIELLVVVDLGVELQGFLDIG